MISIQTNVNALVAQDNLRVTSEFQSKTIQQLTSGYRINSSADDAAGLGIANTFRNNTAELTQGVRNANDGIAQLQIIDGGLNNVSQILDRMKTLATESATSTFTGNRGTLDAEFSQLTSEIDRQAANIGLNTNGANNKSLNVYIGGATDGSASSNAMVNVDLSGAATAVDSTGLGLSGSSVAGAGIDLGAVNTGFVTTSMDFYVTTLDSAGVNHTTTFATTSGTNTTVGDVVADLNKQIAANANTASAGIDFAIGPNGHLMVGGSTAFELTSDAGSASKVITGGAVTDQENTAMYNEKYTGAAMTGAATMTFTNSAGASATVSLANTDTTLAQVGKINQAIKGLGITALGSGTTNNISFQSNNSFTWTISQAGNGGLGGTTEAQTAANTALDPTASAQDALAKITNAVTLLSSTQGKVGAGENKLNYAINLAQSQITNFSAAESSIRDADVAAEAANLTKAQVLVQASMAAMAQANSAPQAVLALLR